MHSTEILINQTLHGYNQGHELLASSVELDSSSKRKMSYLSDLSGPDFSEEFDGYLEGYPLPNGNYVLSRTWKATEMRRPGCVWTHSLILKKDNLVLVDSLSFLNDLFKRPSINESFNQYQKIISINYSQQKSDRVNTQSAILTYTLIDNPEKQIAVQCSDKKESEKIISIVWRMISEDSREKLSFCCGFFSPSQPTRESFQIVFIPKTVRRFSHDKKNVLFFENGQAPKTEELKIFENTDFSSLLAMSYDAMGASQESQRIAEELVHLLNSENPLSFINNTKYAALFDQSPNFALSFFGPEESRLPSLKKISESNILEFIFLHNHLLKNSKLEVSKRIERLSPQNSFSLLTKILSVRTETPRSFSLQLLDQLDIQDVGHLSTYPSWLCVHLITSEKFSETKFYTQVDQRELNSAVYQAFQEDYRSTFSFLRIHFSSVIIRRASIALLTHSNDSAIIDLFEGSLISLDELTISEALSLFKNSPNNFFKLVDFKNISENHIHQFFRNSPSGIHLDRLFEVLLSQPTVHRIQGDLALEILNFTFRRNSSPSNKLFIETYPQAIHQLRGNSLIFERFMQIKSLLPFGRNSSVIDNLESLRLALLVMTSAERIMIRNFLMVIDSKSELRDLIFTSHNLSKKERKKILSQLYNYHGSKDEDYKVQHLIKGLE
jgi:hypothetical protein